MTKSNEIIKKSEKIEIRISENEKQSLKQAANRAGLTISAWARRELIRIAGGTKNGTG